MTHPQIIPRSQLRLRRWIAISVTVLLSAAVVGYLQQRESDLLNSSYFSGYLLLGSILFLTAFNLRKLISSLPAIGSASQWMQVHIYVGLSTFVVFGAHIGWRWPDGWLEVPLTVLYLTVAVSGVYGLLVTRYIPKRLTAVGQEVAFERIPFRRMQLAYEVRQTALANLQTSDVITRFYCNHLLSFFEGSRGLGYWLFPSSGKRRWLLQELVGLQRYLSTDQQIISHRLAAYVQQKDDLDYHYALQSRLKLWLFVHVGLTYSLLSLAIIHSVLVHAFLGSPW